MKTSTLVVAGLGVVALGVIFASVAGASEVTSPATETPANTGLPIAEIIEAVGEKAKDEFNKQAAGAGRADKRFDAWLGKRTGSEKVKAKAQGAVDYVKDKGQGAVDAVTSCFGLCG